MSKHNLAVVQSAPSLSIMPSPSEWGLMHDMAQALLPTGFLPNTIKTPEQAVAIMLKGRELSIPPMYALSNIVVVQGKPSCSAELMLALVQRDHGENAMWVRDTNNEGCTVAYRTGDGVKAYTFTVKDAEKAGITKNPVWRQYPAAMCRARAISAVARMAFPSSIAGMYSPGELGDQVEVNQDGEVVSLTIGEVISNAPETRQDAPQRTEQPQQVSADVTRTAFDDLRDVMDRYALEEDLVEAMIVGAGMDPQDPDEARIARMVDRINADPDAMVEWGRKQLAKQKSKNDPELNPSDEELGIQ